MLIQKTVKRLMKGPDYPLLPISDAQWIRGLLSPAGKANRASIKPVSVQVGSLRFDLRGTWPDFRESVERYGCYEPLLAEVFQADIQGDEIFYDIGSSVGYYTLIAADRLKANTQIHCFEPEARAVALYKENTSHLIPAPQHRPLFISDETKSPDHVRLDDFSGDQAPPPDIIKLDVEGAEVRVIEGGKHMLAEQRPRIYMEVHPTKMVEFDSQGIEKMFNTLDPIYEITATWNHRGPHRGPEDPWTVRTAEDLIEHCRRIVEDPNCLPQNFAIVCRSKS